MRSPVKHSALRRYVRDIQIVQRIYRHDPVRVLYRKGGPNPSKGWCYLCPTDGRTAVFTTDTMRTSVLLHMTEALRSDRKIWRSMLNAHRAGRLLGKYDTRLP